MPPPDVNQFGPPSQVSTTPPIQAGPPENEQDYVSRVQGWEDTLHRINEIAKDPQTRSFLFTLGANLIKDRPKSATTIGNVGTSLLEAQDAAAREGERQFNQADRTRRTTLVEERNAITRDVGAGRAREGVLNRRQELDLARERTSLSKSIAGDRTTTETQRHVERLARLDQQSALLQERLEIAKRNRADTTAVKLAQAKNAKARLEQELKIAQMKVRGDVMEDVLKSHELDEVPPTTEVLFRDYFELLRLTDPEGTRDLPALEEELALRGDSARLSIATHGEEATREGLLTRHNEADVDEIIRRATGGEQVAPPAPPPPPTPEQVEESITKEAAAGRNEAQSAIRKIRGNVTQLSGKIAFGANTGITGGATLEEELGPDWPDQLQQQIDLIETLKETPQMRTNEVEIADETVEKLKSFLKRFGGTRK